LSKGTSPAARNSCRVENAVAPHLIPRYTLFFSKAIQGRDGRQSWPAFSTQSGRICNKLSCRQCHSTA
jgi:hypothetical protein